MKCVRDYCGKQALTGERRCAEHQADYRRRQAASRAAEEARMKRVYCSRCGLHDAAKDSHLCLRCITNQQEQYEKEVRDEDIDEMLRWFKAAKDGERLP